MRLASMQTTLRAAAITMACAAGSAHALPTVPTPQGLHGSASLDFTYDLQLPPNSSGLADLSLWNNRAHGVIQGPVDVALDSRPVILDLALYPFSNLSPASIAGGEVTQAFSGGGSFSMQLAGVPDNFLSGTVYGGTLSGTLGNNAVSITLDIYNASSDILLLAGTQTTLTLSGWIDTPLSLVCYGPTATSGCAGADRAYVGDFTMHPWFNGSQQQRWSIPASSFIPAAPEPQTWLLCLLGLGAAAGVARRRS